MCCFVVVILCHNIFVVKLLPLTDAALSVWCGLVAGVTGALERPWHVDTLTVSAQVLTQLTFIHIWSSKQAVEAITLYYKS